MARADLGDFGRTEPVAVMDTIGVDPGYAHRGVGHALVSQLFANLGALRIERVETVVAPRDFGLLGFLYDVGFAPSQRLPFVRRLGALMTTMTSDDDAMREALREVEDPEAGMNIVDLGLVYGIEVSDTVVRIDMTMTTAACPMADMITDQARSVVAAIVAPGVGVDVQLVWDPPWTPDKMTGIAREHFGWA